MAKRQKHQGETWKLDLGGGFRFEVKLPPSNPYMPPPPPSAAAVALVDQLKVQVDEAAAQGRRLACIDFIVTPVPTWVIRGRMCKPIPGAARFAFGGIAEKGFPVMAAFLAESTYWNVFGEYLGRLIDKLLVAKGEFDESLNKDIKSVRGDMWSCVSSMHSTNYVRVTRGRI